MNKDDFQNLNLCDDDFCDLDKNKICDNCCKCLQKDGIDMEAVKIEGISKNLEENEMLLNELKEDDLLGEESNDSHILDEYEKLDNGEYEDAFEHIEYLEELDSVVDEDLEDLTEEIFPGVRRVKREK